MSKIVVLDNGSGLTKVGLAGENLPSAVIPTLVGRPMLRSGTATAASAMMIGGSDSRGATTSGEPQLKDIMVGDETVGVRHMLDLNFPVQAGIVREDADAVRVWRRALCGRLGLDGPAGPMSDARLAISEPPFMNKKARAKNFELLFENFGLNAVQSMPQGVLALYAVGSQTGMVVDCGEDAFHITPVADGYSMSKGNRTVSVGGRAITSYLLRLLQRRGYDFNRTADFETVKGIKEMFCYTAANVSEEMRLARDTTVLERAMTLPDGSPCKIGAERFLAPEALFRPGFVDVESPGLAEQVWSSLQSCDMDVRRPLYSNIILSGGSTMFPGLPTRLENDLKELFIEHGAGGDRSRVGRFPVKIHDAPLRRFLTWTGASVYATLTAEDPDGQYWLSRAKYEEEGARAIDAIFGHSSV
jgi:actin-related protein 2